MDVAMVVTKPFRSHQVGDVLIDHKQIQALEGDEHSHCVVRSLSIPPPVAASEETS